jgi:hypothetical protein
LLIEKQNWKEKLIWHNDKKKKFETNKDQIWKKINLKARLKGKKLIKKQKKLKNRVTIFFKKNLYIIN